MVKGLSRWAGGLLVVGLLAIASPARAGDTCKDVTIKVTNKLDVKIRIFNFKWWDFDKERWRDAWDLPSLEKQSIDPNGVKTYLKNLAGVKHDKMKLKVEYWKAKKGLVDKWDEGFEFVGPAHKCEDGEINELQVK